MARRAMFDLAGHETTPGREIAAGFATFLTMAYVVVVNPAILADAGGPLRRQPHRRL